MVFKTPEFAYTNFTPGIASFNQIMYLVWVDPSLKIYLATSNDYGQTWNKKNQVPNVYSDSGVGICVDKTGMIHLVFVLSYSVYHISSLDAKVWNQPVIIDHEGQELDVTGCPCIQQRMNQLIVTWTSNKYINRSLSSDLDGNSWSAPSAIKTLNDNKYITAYTGPALTVDDTTNFLYIVYGESNTSLSCLQSQDGQNWSRIGSLSQASTSLQPSLICLNGILKLAFVDSSTNCIVVSVSYSNGSSWGKYLFLDEITFSSITGPALTVYYGWESEPIYYMFYLQNFQGPNTVSYGTSADFNKWSSIRPLEGISSTRPFIIADAESLYLYWKGKVGDNRVWTSTSYNSGKNWTKQSFIENPDILTNYSPSVAISGTGTKHLMFVNLKNEINHATSIDGITWIIQSGWNKSTTDMAPCLIRYNSVLFLYWKVEGKTDIMYCKSFDSDGMSWSNPAPITTLNVTSNVSILQDTNNLLHLVSLDKNQITHYVSQDGIKWMKRQVPTTFKSRHLPAFGLANQSLYLIWNDLIDGFFSSTSNTELDTWTPRRSCSWLACNDSPVLTNTGEGKIHMVYRGTYYDFLHYTEGYTRKQWSSSSYIPWYAVDQPTLTNDENNNLMIFSKKRGTNPYNPINALQSSDGGITWEGQNMDFQILSTMSPSVCLTPPNQLNLLIYVPGTGTYKDQMSLRSSEDLLNWNFSYAQLQGRTSDKPAVIYLNSLNSTFLVWKGIVGDNRIWSSLCTNGNWSDQDFIISVDGTKLNTSSGPTIAQTSDNVIHLVYRNSTNNQLLHYTSVDAKTWTKGVIAMPFYTDSQPELIVSNKMLYVFWTDLNSNTVSFAVLTDNNWNLLGLGLTSSKYPPTLITIADSIHMVSVNPDGTMAHQSYDDTIEWDLSTTINLLEYNNWMEQHYNSPTSNFKNQLLFRVIFPGTHDSGCYSFPWYYDWILTRPIAQTQNQTFYGQLMNGIRFLDLRFHADFFGRFKIYHDKYPTNVYLDTDLIPQLLQFLNENPNEIIILSFSHFEGKPTSNFFSEIFDNLSDYLIPPNRNFNQIDNRTVKDVITQSKRRIIANFQPMLKSNVPSQYKPFVWSNMNTNTYDPHAEAFKSGDPLQVKNIIEEQFKLYSNNGQFWVTQTILTPTIIEPRDVFSAASRINPLVPGWLTSTAWKGKVNIVIEDYFTQEFLNTIVNLNN